MSENQQNDRQEDVLPDEPVGADGAESAEPVNGSCPERPADAPTQESVPEVTNPSSEGSQYGTRYPIPLDIRGTAGI